MQHQPTAERMHPYVRPGAPPGHDWDRKGIIVNIEYQRFCPFIGIGPPTPFPGKECAPPPPPPDEGTDTLVLYVPYTIIHLRYYY